MSAHIGPEPISTVQTAVAVVVALLLLGWPYLLRAYRALTQEDVARRYRDSHGLQ